MNPKLGRPPGTSYYPVRLRVSVSDSTWAGISRYMATHQVTISEACRDALESWFDQLSD